MLAGTVALGITNAWVRGDTLIGLFKIPSLAPGDKALKSLIENLHGTFANVLLIAAGLHALAGLTHHFLLHDDVLSRMLPRRTPR
jgi:cytochrome b561